ncbi:hypothetical protein ElyMa_001027900 [Elysia marginata]|uniref:Uncharacterized protein n=1 Tax=Elysia marginata TaxID=1093978 RepID=A0AAV4HNZ8_9GAST|nr:hypothetical protein ElyMa_001027900 [Elysia marginata]
MEAVLQNTTWLANDSREGKLEKLEAMSVVNVLPEQGFEDETLEKKHRDLVLSEEDYFLNEVNIRRAELIRKFEVLRDEYSSNKYVIYSFFFLLHIVNYDGNTLCVGTVHSLTEM